MLTAERTGPSAHSLRPHRIPSALVLWSSAVFGLQIGFARMGYGLALPAIRSALHGNYTLYGTINAASLAGYLAGALIAPLVIRRTRNAVLISSLLGGAALVASAFATGAVVFGIARTLFGLASGVSLVAAAVETLESVEASRRGGASATMWGGIGVGLFVSAFAAGWLARGIDWRIASLVTGVLVAVAGIGYAVAAHRRPAREAAAPGAERTQKLGGFLFLYLSYFSFGFAYIAYATFIVASIAARKGAVDVHATIEFLWAFYGAMSVVGTLAIGRILDRPIGRASLAFTGLASAAGCGIAFFSPHAVILSAVLVGLGLAATPAAATAIVRARSTASSAPATIAAATVAVGLGQWIGPVVAGLSADRFGLGSVVLLACCVYLLQALCASADVFATTSSSLP